MFAFTPDDGRPNRVMRYVERGTLPDAKLLSIYVFEQNLLIIDKQHFATLSPFDQRELLRTHKPFHEITEFTINQPFAA